MLLEEGLYSSPFSYRLNSNAEWAVFEFLVGEKDKVEFVTSLLRDGFHQATCSSYTHCN